MVISAQPLQNCQRRHQCTTVAVLSLGGMDHDRWVAMMTCLMVERVGRLVLIGPVCQGGEEVGGQGDVGACWLDQQWFQ
jgi:hypothetical protein